MTEIHTSADTISDVGGSMYSLMAELYPICRSITGNGVRQSLAILNRHVPIAVHEIATGTKVFDWTVPKEWNIRDAYVKNSRGEKVIDFRRSNLHVVSYSIPVHKTLPLAELKQHLFSLPDHPDWIPHRTTYYAESWGFCLSHNALAALDDGNYEVRVDSSLEPGHLTYGECYLRGATAEEVLVSCHICHPSLCNDNLSGMALATFLAKYLANITLRYSYRFLFIPATIGSVTWLQLNRRQVERIRHGLVVACVGDSGCLTYKRSRRGTAEIDGAVAHVLKHSGQSYQILDFSPDGYDERQYCSPGFDLPVGSLMRTQYGRYPEYHTSADNLDLVRPAYLADTLSVYLAVINVLENNRVYQNTNPFCEPQLGRRGLYGSLGGKKEANRHETALLWVLNYADGCHTLLDIADRSGLEFTVIKSAADALHTHGLLAEVRS